MIKLHRMCDSGLLSERNISEEFREMVRERLGMVLKDASMVLAGKKEAADLCFNLSTETAKFVNDETRWLTLSSTLFFICFIRVLLFQCTPSAVLMISHLHHFASVLYYLSVHFTSSVHQHAVDHPRSSAFSYFSQSLLNMQ